MPFNDPIPVSTNPDTLPRRMQEVELQFGTSVSGLSIPICPATALPAASAAMNGRMLLEDTGSSFTLIAYWSTQRRRFTGTTF
jgi:hypothetical protein